jgi:hypothetical protein
LANRISPRLPSVIAVLALLVGLHCGLSDYFLSVVHEMSLANRESTFLFPNAPAGTLAGAFAVLLKFPLHDVLFFGFTPRINHFINAVAFWLMSYSLVVWTLQLRRKADSDGIWGVRTWLATVLVFGVVIGIAICL